MDLLFTNPIFKDGKNITVRRGTKWSGCKEAFINSHIIYIKTKVMRFIDIPDDELVDEHDPSCRTKEGLLKEMKRVYGEDFSENEIVTIIEFTL